VAFWLVAYLFAATMLGTTLPTPLYVIYERRWHFTAAITTVIYATYAVGVLVALLLAGRSSDQVGRRPVLAAAVGFSMVSTVVFILAPGVGWLFAGRILSGLSAGLVTGTATAALTDISASRAAVRPVPGRNAPGRDVLAAEASARHASMVATAANMGGLGLGPLVAGLFAEYAPAPTVLVFEVYLGLQTLAILGLALVPETVTHRERLSLHYAGLGIPASGRREFIAAGVAGFAAFSLLGLFSSLAPTFLSSVLHQDSHAVSGAVVFALLGTAAVSQLFLGRFPSRPVVTLGLGLFVVALALIVAGLSQASMAIFLAGDIVGGIAVGAVVIGSLSTANRLAPPQLRGRVVSTYFVFSYVGLTIPVIGVGIASDYEGDFRSVLVCAIVLAVLSAVSMTGIRRAGAGS
jgi:MFS family permease